MNVWTEALANIQRHRGPPLDMDIETGEVKPMVKCKGPCGEEKPESEFYLKFEKSRYAYRMQQPCKACISAGARKEASLRRKLKPTTKAKILAVVTAPMTLRQISEAISLSRRPTSEAVNKLIEEGLIRRAGFATLGTNSKVPLYQTTHTGETA